MTKETICLCMIVKNDADVIERCLTSVLPLIDQWLICDTGSTDGTHDIVREFFAKNGKPGTLHRRPWRDAAHNRTEVLELARPHADYSLSIDADDVLEIPAGFMLPKLIDDAYHLDIQDKNLRYQGTQLVRNTIPWSYRGVLHEVLGSDGAHTTGHLPLVIRRDHDGARKRDPMTYQRDAVVLQNALLTESDGFMRSRYTFYLAQSYRDFGEKEKALENYLARAEMGLWQEEVFVALYEAAKLKEQLNHPADDVIAAYLRAHASLPSRIEALHKASRFCRLKGRYEQGADIAQAGMTHPMPSAGLFVEDWVYHYGLLDEFAVNAYWAGNYQQGHAACETLLGSGKLPAQHRARTEANANFFKQKLKALEAAHGGIGADSEPLSQPLKIAIYTIALNEAKHVDRWMKSAIGADYIVVADTGSSDDTQARLRAAGATVHHIVVQPWRFDDARNAALALLPADVDLCISLDMDEFMLPGWREKIEAAWKPDTTRLYHQYAASMNNDGSPGKVFKKGKIHARRGYRWHRMVHEDLQWVGLQEKTTETRELLIGQQQDLAKDRSQYLHLMERAHRDDPHDAQLCFWLGREQMYAKQDEKSAQTLQAYLALPDWHWQDERSEAMRYLARVEPKLALSWLRKAIDTAPHRRELWSDLAEYYHAHSDWINLFWACSNGLERTHRTGSYLEDLGAWGFRLSDLLAIACSRLEMYDLAVKHGTKAVELNPDDRRLAKNLEFYISQRKDSSERASDLLKTSE